MIDYDGFNISTIFGSKNKLEMYAILKKFDQDF